MGKRTAQIRRPQPIERFPLRPRSDGRFVKRIRGRLYYFGRNGDRDGALREYDAVKHDLYAGRRPRSDTLGSITIKRLAYLYLDHLLAEVDAGRLTGKWYGQVRDALRLFVEWVGEERDPLSLRPDDFAAYARHLRTVRQLGPYTYNRERTSIVTMFRRAVAFDWIDAAPRFGPGFAKAPDRELRKARRKRTLDRATIRLLLRHAPPTLKAMLLLGLNGGFGPGDCGSLPASAIDLDAGSITYTRPKTGIGRQVPLWPDTVAALRPVIRSSGMAFRTKFGNAYTASAIGHELAKLIDNVNARITRKRRHRRMVDATMYDLRHTFYTVAMEAGDVVAVKRIMGHAQGGLTDIYLGGVAWDNLCRVVNHVRHRLLAK